jgi:hypothetical protein
MEATDPDYSAKQKCYPIQDMVKCPNTDLLSPGKECDAFQQQQEEWHKPENYQKYYLKG